MQNLPKTAEGEPCEISSIAYHLWEEAGSPSGRYLDFWMKATRLVAEAHRVAEEEAAALRTQSRSRGA